MTFWQSALLSPLLVTICFYTVNTKKVTTKFGQLEGTTIHEGGKTVYKFLNIPFAQPPIGQLRFSKPKPVLPWNDVLDATAYGPSCIQPRYPPTDIFLPNLNQSEDCLQLNVFVPNNVTSSSNRSVMVWIHGGGFMLGQSTMYNGAPLASAGDVIVVTINYRLGILGFLKVNDSLNGNFGLWDQIMGLQWVRENIASFGGNPNSVTIFGESSGGMSVSLLALSPPARGLFHRVIAESGVANSKLVISSRPEVQNRVLLSTGCKNKTLGQMLQCLRQLSPDTVMNIQNDPMIYAFSGDKQHMMMIPIGPVVDGELIPRMPNELLHDVNSESYQLFKSYDFMTGNCNNEGSTFKDEFLIGYANATNTNLSIGISTDQFCRDIIPAFTTAMLPNSAGRKQLDATICVEYSDPDNGKQALKACDMTNDAWFLVPAIETLNAHALSNHISSTYQYSFNVPNTVLDPNASVFTWFQQSPHASDLFYLFDPRGLSKIANVSVDAADIDLANTMMDMWSSFAKTGHPSTMMTSHWPMYDSHARKYLNIDYHITVASHVYSDRVYFWEHIVPFFINPNAPVIG